MDAAVLDALAGFYRTRHDLIADAVTHEQTQHQAATADRNAELATVENEITKTGVAIDRYLTAFERGTMDEELVADRLTKLRAKTKQLRVRRDELTLALDDEPAMPEPATLASVADRITEIILSGSHNRIKALVEDLIATVTITGPDRLVPVFRIPQPRNQDEAATALPAETAPKGVVRTMTTSVVLPLPFDQGPAENRQARARSASLVSTPSCIRLSPAGANVFSKNPPIPPAPSQVVSMRTTLP